MFKRVFNLVYFGAAIAVYAWLLRDDPHTRIIPVLTFLLSWLYSFLAAMMLFRPAGFRTAPDAVVLSPRCQKRLRRWAILLPIPAFLYCLTYNACLTWAGESTCLNKFFGPIARFERAAFSKARAESFCRKTSDRLYFATMKWENVNLRKAISFARAFNRLERGTYKCSPGADIMLGDLYERYGWHRRAHRLFARAENCHNHMRDHIAGEPWQGSTANCVLVNEEPTRQYISVAHVFSHLNGLSDEQVVNKYPSLEQFLDVRHHSSFLDCSLMSFVAFAPSEIPACDHYCRGTHELK